MKYEEYNISDLSKVITVGVVLIVTATDIETVSTHEKLKPIDGFDNILTVYNGAHTYYFGKFGKYNVAHVQSNMGAIGRESAIMTISKAISTITPKFVIMIGIAFGVDKSKQNIGDVLISEGIIPYDSVRIGEKNVYRGQNAPTSKVLLNRFKSVKSWEYLLEDENKASKICAQILSGEELIDDIERRNELIRQFPHAKGGEMEGAGLFAACDGEVEWILVKGICDFADGNKKVNKKANQNIAVDSALTLCLELFNSNHAFESLNLYPAITGSNGICEINLANAEDVLFEIYNTKNESYYIKRAADDRFNNILGQYCIWIHGVSGSGKTNLILRNLIFNNIEYIQISLASCIGLNVIDLFKELLYDLEVKLNDEQHSEDNKNFVNVSRNILSLLEVTCKEKQIVIFIEEIPISSDEDYKLFVEHLFSLMILKKLKNGLNKVKFVLSSIKNPTLHIKQNQLKIHQQVKFIEHSNWGGEDIKKLVEVISSKLNVYISEEFLLMIIKTSDCSPRFIKKFFRNVLACCVTEAQDYVKILDETDRELKKYYNG